MSTSSAAAPGQSAMVLSGGASNGAYEVGVMKALFHGRSSATSFRPFDPGIFTGTSVGAYNAALMASNPHASSAVTVERLEQIWLQRIARTASNCGNGVYRVRGLPLQGFDPGCLSRPLRSLAEWTQDVAYLTGFGVAKTAQFLSSGGSLQTRLAGLVELDALLSESPLDKLIDDTIPLDGLRLSQKHLTIIASDWQNGTVRLFSKQEIYDSVGLDAIRASTAIPGIFPPVQIGGVPFVDGGVLMNTPLRPAIHAGATEIHVIFLDPFLAQVPVGPLESSLDTFYRLFQVIWAQQLRSDIATARGINHTLRMLAEGRELAPDPQRHAIFLHHAGRVIERLRSGRTYRQLTVHAYRPSSGLGGGNSLLDFGQERLQRLIELGYHDAVHHDCGRSGCLRVPAEDET